MKKASLLVYQGMANTLISVGLFSILVVSMGMKLNNVKTISTWANAESFADAMSTRAYTSPNCFAYEMIDVIEVNNELKEIRKTFPGVIDSRKFNQDKYFDCIQNYYASEGTELTIESENVPPYSAYIINFKLRDLEEPARIRKEGDTLSTEPQLDWSNSQHYIERRNKMMKTWQTFGDITSFVLSLALNIIVMPAIGIPVEIEPALKIGSAAEVSNVDDNFLYYINTMSSEYYSEVPVIIRYVSDDGTIEKDNQGILQTRIKYVGT